jgi:hypothetical protein
MTNTTEYKSHFALLECDTAEQAEQIATDHQEKHDGEHTCSSSGFQILVQYCDEGIIGLTETQIELLRQSLKVAMEAADDKGYTQTWSDLWDLKVQLLGED